MKESVVITEEAKKEFAPNSSDEIVQRAQHESGRQLSPLRGVIGNIQRGGGTPSVDSIAANLSSMHTAQRAPVLSALQQTHGNRYVQRVVAGIQAKLKIGQPGDMYEREADRVADEVMRVPEPEIQRQEEEEQEEEILLTKPLVDQITPLVQRQVEEEEEEEMLQAKSREDATSEVTDDLESQINAIRGGGRPLAESERAYFELRFGNDFSRVRIHTEARAADMARVLNAHAFTLGNDIVINAGRYAPETSEGKKLLAHEMTHVVQQNAGNVRASSDQGQALHGSNSPSRSLRPPIQRAAEVHLKSTDLSIQRLTLLREGDEGTEHSPIFGWPEFVDQVSLGEYPLTSRTPGQVEGPEESYARPTEQHMSAFGARPALATGILSGMDAASEDFVFDSPAEIAEDVVGRMQFLDEFMDDVNDIDTEPMVDQSRADLIGYAVYEIMPFEASEFIESEYNRAPGDEDWGPLLEAISRRIVTARSLWTQVAPDLRGLYVMELLVNRYSFPVVGAAAIVGNLWSESRVLPNPDVRALRRPNRPSGAAGLVQWTSEGGRQAGLFQHEFHGRQLGAAILLDMDAQVDYMVNELRTSYRLRVYEPVMGATSEGQLSAATDRVTRYYEAPGPMGQPQESEEHQATLRARRGAARTALRVYRAAHP
ncbi:MAG: DUF4157 domain-containing protein [Methanosarcinales archaeon]|nr:DUF4157 domain-containing protein [Methanosarcinales archaeon]